MSRNLSRTVSGRSLHVIGLPGVSRFSRAASVAAWTAGMRSVMNSPLGGIRGNPSQARCSAEISVAR